MVNDRLCNLGYLCSELSLTMNDKCGEWEGNLCERRAGQLSKPSRHPSAIFLGPFRRLQGNRL